MSNFTDFFPAGGGAGGGAIPDLVGLEYLILSGGGAGGGIPAASYGGGGGGGGTYDNNYFYTVKDVVTPVVVGAGGAWASGATTPGGSATIGSGINQAVILGGGGGTYNSTPTTGGTCSGGRGRTSSGTTTSSIGNAFDVRGRAFGSLDDAAIIASQAFINKYTQAYRTGSLGGASAVGGAGLGGVGQNLGTYWQRGGTGGIGVDPTSVNPSNDFLPQAELQTELIGEVTNGITYIGGGGTGYGASITFPRADPPGGCGRDTVNALANTGGGGGGLSSGGSGFTMIKVPNSLSVTTTGTPSTYVRTSFTIYVWKNTGSIIINS